MRLTRVLVDASLEQGSLVALPPGPAQHLARVLRLGVADPLIIFNGRGGEHAATIESVGRGALSVRVGAPNPIERESPLPATLLQGIARGDKMDQIVQKATELGVARVIPVLTARSNVRLTSDAAQRKQQHWQGVAVAACEQCGRNRVPEIAHPVALTAALGAGDAGLKLVMTPEEGAGPLPALPAASSGSTSSPRSVALLVGPEGGLAPEEVRAAQAAGFATWRLGPRVLRTETAALAGLAALQHTWGDLH